jgi:hypothetical protein
MRRLSLTAVLALAACGGAGPSEESEERAESRGTVFDPLTSTIDRAEGVQQTLDAQAAEQRRRLEEAER